MRFRVAAFFGVSAACAAVLAAACIPDLITDPAATDAGQSTVPQGLHCGDGIITLGQYDGAYEDLDSGEQCDPGSNDAGGDAGVVGCSMDCHVSCEDGGVVDPFTNHCYFPAGTATSLNDDNGAEQTCESNSAHVVTFADERERQFVLSHFASKLKVGTSVVFWVGLSIDFTRLALVPVDLDQIREPGWAATCSGCYAPANVVDGSIPRLVFDAGGTCVLDVNELGWSQFPCSQIPQGVPVLCEREPLGDLWQSCNGGICARLTENGASKRYLYSPALSTADQAKSACRDLGGSLVVFNTRQERETLLRSLIAHFEILKNTVDNGATAPEEVWIGYSANDAGVFVWDVDGGLDASPWGDTEPLTGAGTSARGYAVLVNAAFQTLNYDVQLAHDDTDVPRPYICQY